MEIYGNSKACMRRTNLHFLESICNSKDRGITIRDILSALGIKYRLQRLPKKGNYNIVVDFGNPMSDFKYIYGAHYDVVDGCQGANDNTAGVLTLINLACELERTQEGRKTKSAVVFFDCEEPSHRYYKDVNGEDVYCPGSLLFAYYLKQSGATPDLFVVLDVVGFGNTLFYDTPCENKEMIDMIKKVCPDMVQVTTPTSDETIMYRLEVKSVLLGVLPESEMVGHRETWSLLHTQHDTVETVDIDNINWMVDILYSLSLGTEKEIGRKKESDLEKRAEIINKVKLLVSSDYKVFYGVCKNIE